MSRTAVTLELEGRPGLSPPRQERSRESGRRIVAGLRRLLRERPFERITMAEIAAESGVSIGSIYARFPSKEQLLLALVDIFFREELEAAVAEVVYPRRGRSLERFLSRYFSAVSELFRSHQALIAPLTLRARAAGDSELQRYLTEVNGAIHDRLRRAILEHRGEIAHHDPERAVDLALLWAGSALREAFLFEEPVSKLATVGDEAFVAELVSAICAYLRSGGKR